MPTTDLADEAFLRLDRWIARNGWHGYDPYDIRGQDWFVRLFGRQNVAFRKVRGALALLESSLPPLALRKALGIKKEINAKGMGLIATAYLARYAHSGDATYLQRAEQTLEWLSRNACRRYPGMSWGYPFHWQSRLFFPKGTPSVVVTGTVGDAWLDHFVLTQSSQSLEVAREIARFMLFGLNLSVDEDDKLCFSYTPLDRYQVHNANLFAAAFLARLTSLTGESTYGDAATKAARFTISQQNPDGSFYYWGSEPPSIIDHYHTGFVLRHLHTVSSALKADDLSEALRTGYAFYQDNLFAQDGVPKFCPGEKYPIDIHSCAEALLCINQLGPEFGALDRLPTILEFTEQRMRTQEGWYIAEIRRRRRGERELRVPYMRWGQAWMLLALARLGGGSCE